MSRSLVIGYGSAGRRHARLLAATGEEVAVITAGDAGSRPRFGGVAEALAAWRPGYVVVSNRTSGHYSALKALVDGGYRGRVLVEKPLYDAPQPPLDHAFERAAVGYNLRCHPLLRRLKAMLDQAERIATAHVYVGSYLPAWRPGADYRESYSARKAEGGGVLRDLSHELDYVHWLLGPWTELAAAGGHFSELAIDSDDAFSLLMTTARCPLVSVHMNYLDRVPRRRLTINTHDATIHADLIANVLSVDGREERVTVAADETYIRMHDAMLAGDGAGLCTLDEGEAIVREIAAAERAAAARAWVPA